MNDEEKHYIKTAIGALQKCVGDQERKPALTSGDVHQSKHQEIQVRAVPVDDFEALYQKIMRRLLEQLRVDPIFLRLLAAQPEVVVEIEPRQVTVDGSSLKGRIARLIVAGFFKEIRKAGQVYSELKRTGTEPNSGNVSKALADFVADGLLTREGTEGFLVAPGLKVSEKVLTAV